MVKVEAEPAALECFVRAIVSEVPRDGLDGEGVDAGAKVRGGLVREGNELPVFIIKRLAGLWERSFVGDAEKLKREELVEEVGLAADDAEEVSGLVRSLVEGGTGAEGL